MMCQSFLLLLVNVRSTRSTAKLAYTDAQRVIEGKVLGDVSVTPEHDAAGIAHDIKVLEGLAKKLRVARFANGALSLQPLRLSFQLDGNGLPTDCGQYERTDANELVEEFMLLTNIAVAQHIAVHLPEQALLRRHDTPIERRLVSADFSTSLLPKLTNTLHRTHSKNALLVSGTKWTFHPPARS